MQLGQHSFWRSVAQTHCTVSYDPPPSPTHLDAAALLEVKLHLDGPKDLELAVVGDHVRHHAARVLVQHQPLLQPRQPGLCALLAEVDVQVDGVASRQARQRQVAEGVRHAPAHTEHNTAQDKA